MPLLSVSSQESVDTYIQKISEINPSLRTDLIKKAYSFACRAHSNQFRSSGEPYIIHAVAVSLILAEQNLDKSTIAAALLHDVLEESAVTNEVIKREFGEEILHLVDGVTKIKVLQMTSRQERQAETFRKMLLSMASDLRVIIIKFADRLHNLRTLSYLPPDRIKAIAKESLDIYAPLAHRLGMARLKWEIEDLAFKYLYPKEYKSLISKVAGSRRDRIEIIDSYISPLRRRLEAENIEANVIGRPKNFYSIYRKMLQRNKDFNEIYDILAIRVITTSVRDCYIALGIIHSMWKPIMDKFKDYLSTPKSNGYQSMHTTVVGGNGNIVEMQIRTWEMNQIAEDGIAAHWLYKNGNQRLLQGSDERAISWLRNVIEWQKDLPDSNEFLEFFKVDLFHAEIFVFTPKGDLITLPRGATVLDFAFAVHTELGIHCIGGRVDGKLMPISDKLKSGSTVEILHLSSKVPSIYWLREVKTPKARSAIRRWLRNTGRQESINLGKRMIKTKLRRLNFLEEFAQRTPDLLKSFGVDSLERLYELVGTGELSLNQILQYFGKHRIKFEGHSGVVSKIVNSLRGKQDEEVAVSSVSNFMVRFAKCCNPVPNEPIVGFLTKGRGISVHRSSCQNTALFLNDPERKVRIKWDNPEKAKYIVFLEITGLNRQGLLQEIISVFNESGADVTSGKIDTDHEHVRNKFKIEIKDREQLQVLIKKLKQIKGVERVKRDKDTDNYTS